MPTVTLTFGVCSCVNATFYPPLAHSGTQISKTIFEGISFRCFLFIVQFKHLEKVLFFNASVYAKPLFEQAHSLNIEKEFPRTSPCSVKLNKCDETNIKTFYWDFF